MKYEIWMEGYAATGESGTAQKLGEFEAESFDDAVELLLRNGDHKKYYRRSDITGNHLIWGCTLYDNEKDARRYFG